MILSGHLPATAGLVEAQLAGVAAAPESAPFVGHDHATLTRMLGG